MCHSTLTNEKQATSPSDTKFDVLYSSAKPNYGAASGTKQKFCIACLRITTNTAKKIITKKTAKVSTLPYGCANAQGCDTADFFFAVKSRGYGLLWTHRHPVH